MLIQISHAILVSDPMHKTRNEKIQKNMRDFRHLTLSNDLKSSRGLLESRSRGRCAVCGVFACAATVKRSFFAFRFNFSFGVLFVFVLFDIDSSRVRRSESHPGAEAEAEASRAEINCVSKRRG